MIPRAGTAFIFWVMPTLCVWFVCKHLCVTTVTPGNLLPLFAFLGWLELVPVRRVPSSSPAPSVPNFCILMLPLLSLTWNIWFYKHPNSSFSIWISLQMMRSVKELLQLFLSLDLPHQQKIQWFSNSALEFLYVQSWNLWCYCAKISLGNFQDIYFFSQDFFPPDFFPQNFFLRYIFQDIFIAECWYLTIIVSSYTTFLPTQIILLFQNKRILYSFIPILEVYLNSYLTSNTSALIVMLKRILNQ